VELANTFVIDLPVDATWDALNDLSRVIPCLPGAAVLSIDGDAFEGAVKIKVGPVSTHYEGTGRFVEKDRDAWRAVIQADGKDVGGQGGAKATITATLSEQGGGTRVDVLTDLALSGRAAQFGRGVIADVSNKILGQFAKNLQRELAEGKSGDTARKPLQPRSIDDVEPLDVFGSMGSTVVKYAAPAAGVLVAMLAGVALWNHRAGGGRPTRLGKAAGLATPIVVNIILPGGTTSALPGITVGPTIGAEE